MTFVGGSLSGAIHTIIVPILNGIVAEPTENYTVDLSGIVCTGSNSFTDSQGLGTITDDDAYTISLAGFSVNETDTNDPHDFVATMSGEAQSDVVISFTTTNGSAVATDFTAQTTVLYTIPHGTTSVNIPVTVLGDNIAEAVETFTGTITVSNDNGQPITIGTGTATGTITDDDSYTISLAG